MKLGDMKIGVKLGASFGIVIMAFVLAGGVVMWRLGHLKDLEDESGRRSDDALMLVHGQMHVDELYSVVADAIINKNMTKTEQDYTKIRKEIDDSLAAMDKSVDTDEERGRARKIRDKYSEIFTLFETRLRPELMAGKYNNDTIAQVDAQIDDARDSIDAEYNALVDSIGKEQKAAALDFDETYVRTRIIILLFIALTIVVGIGLALGITRYITGIAKRIMGSLTIIAEGDMTQRVGLAQKDEFGQMAQALDRTVDRVGTMVAGVIAGAQNLSQAVQQIAAGNENLSQRTSEQASSLEEIASTVEQATAAINQNAEHATTANTASRDASVLANEGNTVVKEAVSSITTINESSRKIAEIIGVINDIAFQTNLLALNAAVEAARAGEQGRGFAVVAGEVRNLAQRSGNAAKEIETLIKDSVTKVEAGTQLVTRSGESLEKITDAIGRVSTIITEIAAASLEQKQGMGQVNLAVTELDRMTQDNASLVEETASASEEMANQAEELLSLVKRFTVDQQLVSSAAGATKTVNMHLGHHAKAPAKGAAAPTAARTPRATAPGEKQQLKTLLKDEGFEEF